MRNFNVGDVVVNIEKFQFWNNPYHYQLALRGMVPVKVTDANDEFFTTKANIKVAEFKRGFDDYQVKEAVRHQKNGLPWDGHGQMVNITNNKAGLLGYLNKQFDAAFQKCDEEDAADIKSLEAQIANLQARVAAIKAGKKPLSYKTEIIERDFLNERKSEILKLLDV